MTCFKRPTVDDVIIYMNEKGVDNSIDEAGAFHDYHESSGWMVGKKKMKCWKAAVRTWIRNSKKWSRSREESNRYYQSHADRQRQQANEIFSELSVMECGDR